MEEFSMTAEVGILNRMGVALAADSAVTIGGQGMEKIYNSANKLFALSKYHPVGIMIYGGATFMDIPWETIIKTFREKLKAEKKSTLKEYCDSLIDFLKNDSRLTNEISEQILVHRIFSEVFTQLLSDIEERINTHLMRDDKPSESEVETWIKEVALNYMRNLKKLDIINEFENTYQEFHNRYSQIIQNVVNEYMEFEISDELLEILTDMAFEFISRSYFSNNSTGIVIAGYGEDELFPSLYEYKIEGFIAGKLKIKENDVVRIGTVAQPGVQTAAIKPFAQKEMVETFMYGMDPRLENNTFNTLKQILDVYPDIIKEKILTDLSDENVTAIKELGNELFEYFVETIEEHQIEKFVQPVIDIVRVLPKEELAAMAESLVNLTSFKRKITIEKETVGGPIDVAVITKGDGFIWIKRKHYFKPELNYHFFKNYLRSDMNGNY